jgi:hypothetical protein
MRLGMAAVVVAGLLGLSVSCGGNTDDQGEAAGSIAETCARIEQCDPEPNRQRCEQDISGDRAEAVQRGCAEVIDRVLACDAQRPGSCGASGGYDFAAECEDMAERVGNCLDGTSGGSGGGPGDDCDLSTGGCPNPPCPNTCSVGCSDFAAECSGWPGAPMDCRCTAGAGAGRTYQAPDCAGIRESAAQACR